MYGTSKGIIRSSFYIKNEYPRADNFSWGRKHGSDADFFDYRLNEEGKIEITEKRYIF